MAKHGGAGWKHKPGQAAPDDGFGMQRNFGWLAYRPGLGSQDEDPLSFLRPQKSGVNALVGIDQKSHMVTHDLVVNAARLQEELRQLRQNAFRGLPSLIHPDAKNPPPELLMSQMNTLKKGLQNYTHLFPDGVPPSLAPSPEPGTQTLRPGEYAADDELRGASPGQQFDGASSSRSTPSKKSYF
eukprot:gnl/MRDRNA2_/MRDRNA2_76332_c0_seq1.p1 gnl/MRDRNA2_/MRDRNA2_76332_c0~~gnl/MRDRNA2_/MRDRNA2_76332_c0_seq1.p1  ORF type:complete len:184 (+),score=35.73 gnl/MRDRNA2_/MRDRNA2_76332_c0_seq1:54-605(+)